MVEPGEKTTLIGRVESPGRKFPSYFEKIVFCVSVLGAFFTGQWMWTTSELNSFVLLPIMICGIPLIFILFSELISRFIQVIYVSNGK